MEPWDIAKGRQKREGILFRDLLRAELAGELNESFWQEDFRLLLSRSKVRITAVLFDTEKP